MHVKWNPDFSNLQRETKIGSKNRIAEIGDKIAVCDWGGETTFGSSYRDVREIGIPHSLITYSHLNQQHNDPLLPV